MHVASKLQPGDPSAEEILAVIGELAAGSETRMKTYYPMFQQQATHAYLVRFRASELIRVESSSTRADVSGAASA